MKAVDPKMLWGLQNQIANLYCTSSSISGAEAQEENVECRRRKLEKVILQKNELKGKVSKLEGGLKKMKVMKPMKSHVECL